MLGVSDEQDIEESYQVATIVPPTAVALMVRADGEVELAIPKNEESEWHSGSSGYGAVAIRFLNDPDRVQELADELNSSAN